MHRAVQFTLRGVRFNTRTVRFKLARGTIVFSRGAMRGAIVSLRLFERSDALTIASNESDRVGDSMRSVTDSLIGAYDRLGERTLCLCECAHRLFARSHTLLARSGAPLNASDLRIVPHGSAFASADHLAAWPLRRNTRSGPRNTRSLRLISRSPRLVGRHDPLRATACRHDAAVRSSRHVARSSGCAEQFARVVERSVGEAAQSPSNVAR